MSFDIDGNVDIEVNGTASAQQLAVMISEANIDDLAEFLYHLAQEFADLEDDKHLHAGYAQLLYAAQNAKESQFDTTVIRRFIADLANAFEVLP